MSAPIRQYRRYIDSPAGQIHCRVAGPVAVDPAKAALPPLLCLHMSPKSGWVYEPLIERLGSDRLVVAPDTPGFGMSDRPPAPPDLGFYTDALAAVAEALEPDAAWDVLGYHTGSLIAADMALRYPERVSRLVMISAPLLSQTEIAEFARLGLGRPREWDEDGEALLALWRLVLRWRVSGGALSVCARSLADTLIAGDTGWWGHRAAFAFDIQDALKRLHHPLAIINPGDDLCDATRRAQSVRPDAVFVERPDWAHGFIQEFPDEAADLIALLLPHSAV